MRTIRSSCPLAQDRARASTALREDLHLWEKEGATCLLLHRRLHKHSQSKLVSYYISGFQQKNEDGTTRCKRSSRALRTSTKLPQSSPRRTHFPAVALDRRGFDYNFARWPREISGFAASHRAQEGLHASDSLTTRTTGEVRTRRKEDNSELASAAFSSPFSRRMGCEQRHPCPLSNLRLRPLSFLREVIGRACAAAYDLNDDTPQVIFRCPRIPFDFTANPVIVHEAAAVHRACQSRAPGTRPPNPFPLRRMLSRGTPRGAHRERNSRRLHLSSPRTLGPSITQNSCIIGKRELNWASRRMAPSCTSTSAPPARHQFPGPGEPPPLPCSASSARHQTMAPPCLRAKAAPTRLSHYHELADIASGITAGTPALWAIRPSRPCSIPTIHRPPITPVQHLQDDRWDPRAPPKSHITCRLDSDGKASPRGRNPSKGRAYVRTTNLSDVPTATL